MLHLLYFSFGNHLESGPAQGLLRVPEGLRKTFMGVSVLAVKHTEVDVLRLVRILQSNIRKDRRLLEEVG